MIKEELKQQVENLLGSVNPSDVAIATSMKALITSYEARELSRNELLEKLSVLEVLENTMANTVFQRLINAIS